MLILHGLEWLDCDGSEENYENKNNLERRQLSTRAKVENKRKGKFLSLTFRFLSLTWYHLLSDGLSAFSEN